MDCLSSDIRAAPIIVAICLSLGGCEHPSEESHYAAADASPALALVEELRIGSMDDPNYGFTSINQVDVDQEGRVYVFDRGAFEIRAYSSDGALLHRVGRRGEGPGEFHRNTVRFGVVGDTIWAWSGDIDPGRITLFDLEGRVLSTASVEPVWATTHSGCSVIGPGGLGADGLFIGEPAGGYLRPCETDSADARQLPDSIGIPLVRFTSDGSAFDTVGVLRYSFRSPDSQVISVGSSQYQVPDPPSSLPLRRNLPAEGFIQVDRPIAGQASGGEFSVTKISLEGDTVFARVYQYTPVGYPDAMLDSIARTYSQRSSGWAVFREGSLTVLQADPADSAEGRAEIRRRMTFPEFQPTVQAIQVGKDGSIWLRRETTAEGMQRWSVLDPEGTPVGELRMPTEGHRLAVVSMSTIWAVESDEFGVPWLVRYRVEHADPA